MSSVMPAGRCVPEAGRMKEPLLMYRILSVKINSIIRYTHLFGDTFRREGKSVALHGYQFIKYFAELFHAVGFRYNAPEPVFPVISHNGII